MAKYHISNDGTPRPCSATTGNCPLGASDAEHFQSVTAARQFYEEKHATAVVPSATKKETVPAVDPMEERGWVSKTIEARSLNTGDFIDGDKVIDFKNGTRNTTAVVETPDGKKKTKVFTREQQLNIERSQLTAQALRLRWDDYVEKDVKRTRDGIHSRLIESSRKLSQEVAEGREISSFTMGDIIENQASESIWKRVDMTAKAANISQAEAARNVAADYRDHIDEYVLKSGLSRSTSVISNAMEDAKNEAILKFLRDTKSRWESYRG